METNKLQSKTKIVITEGVVNETLSKMNYSLAVKALTKAKETFLVILETQIKAGIYKGSKIPNLRAFENLFEKIIESYASNNSITLINEEEICFTQAIIIVETTMSNMYYIDGIYKNSKSTEERQFKLNERDITLAWCKVFLYEIEKANDEDDSLDYPNLVS